MRLSLGRHLAAGLLSASLALDSFVLPACALTVEEVGKVLQLLGKLGSLAYDEEEADQWFDDDTNREGCIAKAGFTGEDWKEGARQFESTFSGLAEKVDDKDLNSKQKAEVRSFVETTIAETWALRAEGEQDIDPVQPYAAKLNELLGDGKE